MLDKLTSADFLPHLYRTFPLVLASHDQVQTSASDPVQLALELIEVQDLGAELAVAAPRSRAFSLVFREPYRTYLPQRIYTIEHPTLGALDIFLVPISHDANGILYQAIFT